MDLTKTSIEIYTASVFRHILFFVFINVVSSGYKHLYKYKLTLSHSLVRTYVRIHSTHTDILIFARNAQAITNIVFFIKMCVSVRLNQNIFIALCL